MNRILLTASILCLFTLSFLQAQDRDVIAGIPVNYDESKTGDYTQGLPDLLTFENGKKVTRPSQWAKRRKDASSPPMIMAVSLPKASRARLAYTMVARSGR